MNDDANKMQENTTVTALRAEAATLTPAFSEHLHQRIMQRIRQEARVSGAAPLPVDRYRPRWRGWPRAVAACLIIGVGVWMTVRSYYGSMAPANKAVAHAPVPSLKPVEQLIAKPTQVVRQEIEDGKYAYLDRDAQRFAGYILSQLPKGSD